MYLNAADQLGAGLMIVRADVSGNIEVCLRDHDHLHFSSIS